MNKTSKGRATVPTSPAELRAAANISDDAPYLQELLRLAADQLERATEPEVTSDEYARREQLADRLSWPQPSRADLDAAADLIRRCALEPNGQL